MLEKTISERYSIRSKLLFLKVTQKNMCLYIHVCCMCVLQSDSGRKRMDYKRCNNVKKLEVKGFRKEQLHRQYNRGNAAEVGMQPSCCHFWQLTKHHCGQSWTRRGMIYHRNCNQVGYKQGDTYKWVKTKTELNIGWNRGRVFDP